MQNEERAPFLNISWQELLFFLGYFFCLPIISDLQYAGRYGIDNTINTILGYSLISHSISFIPELFFYLLILPLLFRKKYLLFGFYLLLYFVFCDFYLRYAVDLLISEMRFLPEDIWRTALGGYNHSKGQWIRQSISLFMMDLMALLALAYFVRSVRQEEQISQLRKTRLSSELDYLKTQINPSFFFDTLGSIRSLALKGSEETPGVVSRLSEIMRYVLYRSEARVPLQKELDFIANYVAAEQIRLRDTVIISFDVQGKTNGLVIEPVLLIPFIQLALNTVNQHALIEIVALISECELTLEVRSDLPFSPAPNKIIQRLDLLYAGRYSLELNGHVISLILELTHEH